MATAIRTPRKPRKTKPAAGSPMARMQSYIDGVRRAKIVACKWVKLAVARHLKDLKGAAERGFYFDAEEATKSIQFLEALPHSKGKWAGKLVPLQPWECFIWGCVYGWKRSADGFRRFRTVMEIVARKNGKTTRCASVSIKALVCDGERGAEVYSAATKKDQAKIVWSEARKMVLKCPSLRKLVNVFRDSLVVKGTESTYKPLGRDADTLDGLNPSCTVIDEVHAHKTREMWDVIESGTGAREQPLLIGVTTAGDGSPESIYAELKKHTEDVLSGAVQDDTWFGVIYTLDEGDSWKEERNWIKANPNLGVSVFLDDMRRLAEKAANNPGAVANFRRKRCNEDVEYTTPWLPTGEGSDWQQCGGGDFYDGHGLRPEAIAALRGRECWVGADLSSLHDLTAVVFAFPTAESIDLVCFTWCPRENAIGRQRDRHVPYVTWADMGLLRLTEGNSVDYDEIRATLRQARDQWGWDIKHVAFDPNNARYVLTKLAEEDGFNGQGMLVEHQQTCGYMNDPIAAAEKAILDHKLRHGGHAVLRWCVGNAVIYQDTGGRRRFNKKKAREKIDLAVAMAMALGRATSGPATAAGGSIYDTLDHVVFV